MTADQRPWKVSEVLEATGGRLLCPDNDAVLTGISIDSRTIDKGALFVALSGQQHDGHRFVEQALSKGAGGVVVSEAYAAQASRDALKDCCCFAVPDTLRALGQLAAFRRRHSDVSVVAVTGTNGKTTTKEMTAAVLGRSFSVLKTEGNFNNLVGVPLTLFRLREDHEWAVLELGMNHPGEIAQLAEISKPQVGIITNVGAGHLEGVRNLDGVARAKGELLEALGQDGTAVLNVDDERLCRMAEGFPGRVVTFGIQSSAEVWAVPVSQTTSRSSFDLCWYDESTRVRLNITGLGAIYNGLAAAAVGYRLGLSMEEVKEGLESIQAMPGRMEILKLPGGLHAINDTYNANPASMAQAVETLCALKGNGRGVFIAGDMLELGEYTETAHSQLGVLVARSGIARLFVTGDHATKVADGAVGAGMEAGRVFVGSKAQILDALKSCLGPGDWILVKGSRMMAMEDIIKGLQGQGGDQTRLHE
jgi:UDP-N-acetylmuramoyl-tripeptide--D-alanyl-D-alanine ligase